MKISIKTVSLSLFTALLFGGCSTLLNSDKEYYTSKVALNSKPVHQSIIKDITHFLTPYYPISQTTFAVTIEDSSYTYGLELENGLRRAGYGVVYLANEGTVPFAYKLSYINKSIIRATYNVGSANISRLYQQKGAALKAISPFTTRGLPQKLALRQPAPSPQTPSLESATVIASTLNVRNLPSVEGEIVDRYTQGMTLQVDVPFTSRGELWCKVYDESGEERYVATKYIEYRD